MNRIDLTVEAEESVLGAMLVSEPAVSRVVDDAKLKAGDFYLDRHQAIFGVMVDLYSANKPCDELMVSEALISAGKLDEVGGRNFISELAAKVPAPGNASSYAEIVREGAVARSILAWSQELSAAIEDGQIPSPGELASQALVLADKVATKGKDRLEQGGGYLLDVPQRSQAIWGVGDQVLWASGESLIITAPQGVGKTTVMGQLAFARTGVRGPDLLGLPVAVDERPVLYVAADRPEQARRSFARMVTEQDRDVLDSQLMIWRGPPPVNVVDDPGSLVRWIESTGAGTAIFDSLKDLAIGLAEDAVGAAVNQAIQGVLAAGIEFAACHHQKKSQDGRKPRSLDDVYGSTWLTAGAGSVVLLWGKPGDNYVELEHLKQPDAEVGPMEIRHDHERGTSTVPAARDLVEMARHGVTVKVAAAELYSTDSPDRNQIERARRKLEKLASSGVLERRDPGRGEPVRFTACVTPRDTKRDPSRQESRRVTNPDDLASQLVTDMVTDVHAANGRPPGPLKGAADPARDRSMEAGK